MDIELDELKRVLRSKSFALDDVVPLMQKAARVIERLQAENLALVIELHKYQAIDTQLAQLKTAFDELIAADDGDRTNPALQALLAAMAGVSQAG